MTRAEPERVYMAMEFALLEADRPAMSEQSVVMVVCDLVLACREIELEERLPTTSEGDGSRVFPRTSATCWNCSSMSCRH